MKCTSLLLFSAVVLLIITISTADNVKKKKTPTKKNRPKKTAKKRIVAVVIDQLETPDSEVGSSCFDACFPNASRFDAHGRIKDVNKYGLFEEICGKTYLLGSKKLSWAENWQTCCSLGMSPVMFESTDEFRCFYSTVMKSTAKQGPFSAGNSLWMGGFKYELDENLMWCSKNMPEPILDTIATDVSGPPGNKMKVGQMHDEDKLRAKRDFKCLRFEPATSQFLIIDKCDAKSVFLACESLQKPTMDRKLNNAIMKYIDYAPNTNCQTKCKPTKCANHKTLGKIQEQQEISMQGDWISKRGQYFFVAKDQATLDKAKQTCCQLGATLLSIKNDAKRACLKKLVMDLPELSGEWWTSGTDEGCDGNFRWCSVDRPFLIGQFPPWAQGHPKASGDCVTLQLGKIIALKTQDCSAKKKFICEFPGFGSKSLSTVHKNCVDLFGLTADQQRDLAHVSKYTFKMKCYLRCMGDILVLFENGRLQEENFLKASEVYLGKKDMKNTAFNTYEMFDDCASRATNNDTCQNAFELFKCTQEWMPLLHERVLNWEFGIVKLKEKTTPRICYFHVNNACDPQRSVMKMFVEQKTTPDGGSAVVAAWNKQIWFKSEPILKSGYSLQKAFDTCCSLGMRLPIAKNADEFRKILELMDANNTDNFFGPTYSSDSGDEKWCSGDETLEPALSTDAFRQLANESSVLVAKKGQLKLSAVPPNKIQHDFFVTQFFCQPYSE